MVVSNFILRCGTHRGAGSLTPTWQWQPITVGSSAAHDPNPPITIDSTVVDAEPDPLFLRTLMGMGL